MWRIAIFSVSPSPHLTPLITTKTIREKKNYELSDTGQLFRLVREIFNINIIDYYHAWEPLFSHLRATAIYGIITLESHHYI